MARPTLARGTTSKAAQLPAFFSKNPNQNPRSQTQHQDLDVVALLWGRNEGFSPAATRLPRHSVSFQPIRVFAKKIDSIARDDSFLIGCVPAGGVIPKIFATIKLPIRGFRVENAFSSVPSSNGLPVCGFTTNWQIRGWQALYFRSQQDRRSHRGSWSSARVIHSRWPQRPASTFTAPSRPRIYIVQCTAEFIQRPLHWPAQRWQDFVSGRNSASWLDRVFGPRRPVLRRAVSGITGHGISTTGTGE
jgi:hypothetical protein